LPYNWETGRIASSAREVLLSRPTIVEGVSVLHPELAPLYDLRVWVECDLASTSCQDDMDVAAEADDIAEAQPLQEGEQRLIAEGTTA
jgi:hypothetical protein